MTAGKDQSPHLSLIAVELVSPADTSSIDTESSKQELSGNTDQKVYPRSWKLALVIFSLCLGTFLMALDVNIIGVALPHITTVFKSLDDVSWYASAYLLTITAFQPTMGFLYKSFDVRMVYFMNILIFEVGSVLCAASPVSNVFILGRAVAGIGAAGLLQGALAIIGLIIELEKRPLYMGIVVSVFGLSVCVGPVMGGAFIDKLSWRWCFWINLPIGAVTVFILVLFLRVPKVANEFQKLSFLQKLLKMDLIGTVTFFGAICCMLLALQWGGQTLSWSSNTIIGLLTGFGLFTIVFVIVQWIRDEDALIPPRILRQRSILVSCVFLFFVSMFNYVYAVYLPFYFQAVQDVSPVTSGVRMIPFVVPQIVFIGLCGYTVMRYGYYVPYMIAGMAICSIGAGLVTLFDVRTPTAEWVIFLAIAGMGLGSSMQLPYTAVQVVLSDIDVPVGNALLVFFNSLGGMIGIPIAQSLFLSSLRHQVQQRLPDISPLIVLKAGASNLRLIAGSSTTTFSALQQAYAIALRNPLILALAAACCATVTAPWMDWRNLKSASAQVMTRDDDRIATTETTA